MFMLLNALTARGAENAVVYVTDKLRLGMFADEQTNTAAFRTLESGDRLEVLERALMSVRVKTDDGTEGWVKSTYLVSTPPAAVRLSELETAASSSAEELREALNMLDTVTRKNTELTAALAAAERGTTDLPVVRNRVRELERALSATADSVHPYWVAALVLAALLSGILLGYYYLDFKVRKLFGGHRLHR